MILAQYVRAISELKTAEPGSEACMLDDILTNKWVVLLDTYLRINPILESRRKRITVVNVDVFERNVLREEGRLITFNNGDIAKFESTYCLPVDVVNDPRNIFYLFVGNEKTSKSIRAVLGLRHKGKDVIHCAYSLDAIANTLLGHAVAVGVVVPIVLYTKPANALEWTLNPTRSNQLPLFQSPPPI